MKKIVVLLAAIMLASSTLVACGENTDHPGNDTSISDKAEVKFVEANGKMTYTDTANSPFDGGLKIEISNTDNTAKFIVTQTDGTETVDYYLFDYANNIFEKYYYVSAMGTAYYYTADITTKEVTKVEDGERNDKTESMKKSGRWDGAVETVKSNISDLENYFSTQYGVSVADACKDANFGK